MNDETIICPKCEKAQTAVVKHTQLWQICEFCQHVIMESEWIVEDAKTHTAPDLLEACKAALDWRGLDGDGISDPTRQQLIKAIKKAEKPHAN